MLRIRRLEIGATDDALLRAVGLNGVSSLFCRLFAAS